MNCQTCQLKELVRPYFPKSFWPLFVSFLTSSSSSFAYTDPRFLPLLRVISGVLSSHRFNLLLTILRSLISGGGADRDTRCAAL